MCLIELNYYTILIEQSELRIWTLIYGVTMGVILGGVARKV